MPLLLLFALSPLFWVGHLIAEESSMEGSDQTDWPAVITRLRQEMHDKPGFAMVRQQLAVAHNNYGILLGNQGQWGPAMEQLEEALRLDETNELFRANLSNIYLNQAYDAHQRHDEEGAIRAIDQALSLDPNAARAYALRGEIEYGRQRLKEAQVAWQQAIRLDPTQTVVAERLGQVTEELPLESKFEKLSQAYFDLRYEDHLERPVGFDIRDALLEARRSVGSDFAYWPKHKIVVLVYSAESFRILRQETPDWVAGQFDGKIRVPLPSQQLDIGSVERTIFHEYAHALIRDLSNGKCPTWLNEGLAEYEGRQRRSIPLMYLASAYGTGKLIPWTELSDHFSLSLPAATVALAYEQSYSIAHHLIGRYGFWRIRRLLKAISEGQAWETALTEEFRMKLPRLEERWREELAEFLNQPD